MPATVHASPRAKPAGLDLLPGVMLCLAIAALATVLDRIEARLVGRAWLEALVLAILLGTAIRAVWTPPPFWARGVAFSAKTLLEIAVVLLGISVSAATVLAAGLPLLAGIAAVVALALALSYAAGRALGLPRRLATLVACGNSICGNSAIAAVAPVIGATARDVSAAIAFTAVLGVAVVLALPLTIPLLRFSALQYGAFAGLTVYAVPQVLAATSVAGPIAVQIGTLVKLTRVLMLGPVVIGLSLMTRRSGAGPRRRLDVRRLVPWFIVGFLAMAALRSAGLIPAAVLAPAGWAAGLLTVTSMAALGLGTDLRAVSRAGLPVTLAVSVSLAGLGTISLALIRLLGLP